MVAALLTACSIFAGSLAGPAPARPPASAMFTAEAIDRAVKRVDMRAEQAKFVALHPDSPLPGVLPSYAAVITVEDRIDRLTPDYQEYKTWPGFGWGGRQGPAYDKWTGIPWWF